MAGPIPRPLPFPLQTPRRRQCRVSLDSPRGGPLICLFGPPPRLGGVGLPRYIRSAPGCSQKWAPPVYQVSTRVPDRRMSFITDVTGLWTCLGSVPRPPRRPSACSSSTSHIRRFLNSAIFAPFRSGRVFTTKQKARNHMHSTIARMLGGPARTAQAQGSGRGSPEHETACYGGA